MEQKSNKACKNCRYYTNNVIVGVDEKEYRLCAQSTEFQKDYVAPDDWCDRFTGASWMKE